VSWRTGRGQDTLRSASRTSGSSASPRKTQGEQEEDKMKLILKIAAGVVLAVVALTVGCSALVATSVDSSGNVDLTDVSSGGALGDVAGAVTGSSQAQRSAENYLDTQAFSRKGLIEQLKFEGYSHAEAVEGVDAAGADWMNQAAKKAGEYLDTQPFSRSGLQEQLEFEGFTPAQAAYGVSVAYR
jgi:host cell surface-exposed lipoprotein